MADGPGKYDAPCVSALVETKATAAVLIIIGGEHGSGFSVNIDQSRVDATFVQQKLPSLLRQLADSLEESTTS